MKTIQKIAVLLNGLMIKSKTESNSYSIVQESDERTDITINGKSYKSIAGFDKLENGLWFIFDLRTFDLNTQPINIITHENVKPSEFLSKFTEQPKNPITPVIFRKFKDRHPNNLAYDIVAIFPYDVQHTNGNVLSYQHYGQHSEISDEYTKMTDLATPEEYTDLLRELQSIGYDNLKVIKKRNYKKSSKALWEFNAKYNPKNR